MKPKPQKTELLAEEVRQIAYKATNPVEREILIEAAVRLKDLFLIAEFYRRELGCKCKEARKKNEAS